jgi:hypothetical protein
MKYLFTLGVVFFLFSACRQDGSIAQNQTLSSEAVSAPLLDTVPITPKILGRLEVLDILHPAVRRKDQSLDTACRVIDQELFLRFMAETNQDGRVFITDSLGRQVKMLHEGRIKPGFNEFAFNTEPLNFGSYDLFVTFQIYADTIQRIRFTKSPPRPE